MSLETRKSRHDKFAPYWAVGLVLLGSLGLATSWINFGAFWKGYVLDMVGPAWNYILVRWLFRGYSDNAWTRFFTPSKTFFLMLLVAFGIETMQYFELYESTYDPWDFLAYVSILLPIYILDLIQTSREQ